MHDSTRLHRVVFVVVVDVIMEISLVEIAWQGVFGDLIGCYTGKEIDKEWRMNEIIWVVSGQSCSC